MSDSKPKPDETTFSCDMRDICKSCVLNLHPFQCCYHEFLLTKRECNFARCPFTSYCPHANLASTQEKESQLLKTIGQTKINHFKNVAAKLPSHFIPEVMPMEKERQNAMTIVNDLNTPVIAVSLQNFFRGVHGNILLRKARRQGLKQFLGYTGQIILTTDIKDRLCDWFVENPSYFRRIVEDLKPDYLTSFDTYTYGNVPAIIARIKMLETQVSMQNLTSMDCEMIGLALGATPDQIYEHVKMLTKQGCKIIAHPVYELRKKSDTDAIRWRVWLSKKLGAKTLLLSCSPGFTAKKKVYSDYYSSWSWFASVSSKDSNALMKRKEKLSQMMNLAKSCSKQAKL